MINSRIYFGAALAFSAIAISSISASADSLKGTTWLMNNGSTLVFDNTNKMDLNYPNGQTSKFVWAENNGNFWTQEVNVVNSGKVPSYIYIHVGSYGGSTGSGTVFNSPPNNSSVSPDSFTMTKQ